MNGRNALLGIGLAVMVALVVGLAVREFSRPPADRILVAGDVRSVVRTVSAPSITYPILTNTVKIVSNAAPGKETTTLVTTVLAGPQASASTSRSAGIPVVAGALTAVNVQVGDHVTTGTILAQLDTKTLELGVAAAKLNETKTKTNVKVLNNGIDKILDNIDKLETGRAALATGKAALATGKAQLAAGEAQLAKAKAVLLKAKAGLLAARKPLLDAKAHRSSLESQLAALQAQAATFPPGGVPPALQQQIAKLEGLLASIDPGLAKIAAGLKQVNTGLAKIAAGEAKLAVAQVALATGAAKLAAGAAQLDTAADALDTAKKQAYKARDVTKIIASGANVGVVLAEVQRDQATIVSPVSGFVTQAPSAGTVAIKGAPLVRIRPDDVAVVDTYVDSDQLSSLRLGSIADITFDSAGGRVMHGTLSQIGSVAEFPPTSFPTDITHMTRTVKITFRLDSGDQPPAGTPVDIAIHTN